VRLHVGLRRRWQNDDRRQWLNDDGSHPRWPTVQEPGRVRRVLLACVWLDGGANRCRRREEAPAQAARVKAAGGRRARARGGRAYVRRRAGVTRRRLSGRHRSGPGARRDHRRVPDEPGSGDGGTEGGLPGRHGPFHATGVTDL